MTIWEKLKGLFRGSSSSPDVKTLETYVPGKAVRVEEYQATEEEIKKRFHKPFRPPVPAPDPEPEYVSTAPNPYTEEPGPRTMQPVPGVAPENPKPTAQQPPTRPKSTGEPRRTKKTQFFLTEWKTDPPDPFHRFFDWLETAKEYKAFTKKKLKSIPDSLCLLCTKPVTETEYISLQNGECVHQDCYWNLYDRLISVDTSEKAHDLFAVHPDELLAFRWINTNWPTYPPDWSVRRETILQRAGRECEDCGEYEDVLDVHHMRPIAAGGKHSFDNLKCLCRDCHEHLHKHQISTDNPQPARLSAYTKRLNLIQQALAEGKDIAFHYRDYKKKESDRIITPRELTRPGRDLCIAGFCHLRRAPREFNIRRMSGLKIK